MPDDQPIITTGPDGSRWLERNEALKLARLGKDVWNGWATSLDDEKVGIDFSRHDFTNDHISFSGFIFPGDANFFKCTFKDANFSGSEFKGGKANFSNANFNGKKTNFLSTQFSGGDAIFFGAKFPIGYANFSGAKFNAGADFSTAEFTGGSAKFSRAIFSNVLKFEKARFEFNADFSQAQIDSAAVFKDAFFKRVPDFRYTNIKVHFSLHGMKVELDDWLEDKLHPGIWSKRIIDAEEADKLRRLKELAGQAKDHEREQDFFALELQAKRFHETKGFWRLMLSVLYQQSSDFGRSIVLPFRLLLLVWLLFGTGFGLFSQFSFASFLNGLRLSSAVLMPFSVTAKASFAGAQEALYGKASEMSLGFDFAVITESLLGLACVFLIGLALRNRFKI